MKTINDVRAEGSTYEISLSKLMGKKIKDIHGYISNEFGDPSFKLTKVLLEDDTYFWVEGEHDFPYIVDGGVEKGAKLDTDQMQTIYDEENPDEA